MVANSLCSFDSSPHAISFVANIVSLKGEAAPKFSQRIQPKIRKNGDRRKTIMRWDGGDRRGRRKEDDDDVMGWRPKEDGVAMG
ncbi:hypothetical protein L6452_34569 [Arctium lappa]|uniref:Uncharacterized protein n=1 Tax=Arctium lappa TaxID=4217 RepID=A0ACB8YHX3_ARCLA|nr:hypothetical protein L6452_34569 [Arctium lappa]